MKNQINLPNAISLARFLSMPVLLWLAWHGFERIFLILLTACLFSDMLDGWIARKYQLHTELGSRLDSWSDFFIYSTMALGGWWLWPDVILRELSYDVILLVCFIAPTVFGIIKFSRFTSYHTWSVKLASLLVGTGSILMFAGGPVWIFHLSVPFCMVAAIEEILITLVSTKPHSNTRTLWHAMRSKHT